MLTQRLKCRKCGSENLIKNGSNGVGNPKSKCKSTNPAQSKKGRQDEAFLVEGQHKFRFGWHKISSDQKLYQGLNPYDKGVLVFRDDKSTNDNRLTDADIQKGIDNQPNQSINIHWNRKRRHKTV